jgi:ribonuclease HI
MTLFAYTDGASRGNPGESGIGIILRDELGSVVYAGGGYIGRATNNIAEYQALLACLRKAIAMECKHLVVHSDSQLMVRQILGQYKVKDKVLQTFHREAKTLLAGAPFTFKILHVEREQNGDADELANSGIDNRRPLEP